MRRTRGIEERLSGERRGGVLAVHVGAVLGQVFSLEQCVEHPFPRLAGWRHFRSVRFGWS